ncbi:retropepsin-like aspartic protease family protein [Roseateles cellulosilyticus]|uniref:Retroviral-like aspartic protease family protein n=1 Tax=Pelomonas cellulosilytica TaxID=2906762 RepID=A0ABS8XWX6_9BURK|nr:TIGR02281 family clan AA aspartic protease [Pelomonas sp. P8]MCE4555126.1 retroviral-like aspartic protease family protein [Pelomonas sp. P8]
MHRRACLFLLPALGAAIAQPAPTQVQLNGMLGSRAALLIIDGEPRTLEVGASARGVRLVALEGDHAVIEVAGRRQSLALGTSPARLAPAGPTVRQIVMTAGPGGHFTTSGLINGQTTSFLLDTGATSVAISQIEAERLGLRYANGRRVMTQTANGAVPAYMIQLMSIRIGEVEVRDVTAIVIPGQMNHVLLGNSFLSRFQMRRENDVMTLDLRY